MNPDELPTWIRIRPDLNADDAERIAQLPEIEYAGIWAQIQAHRVRGRAHARASSCSAPTRAIRRSTAAS